MDLFSRLPPEIRNMIYKLLAPHEIELHVSTSGALSLVSGSTTRHELYRIGAFAISCTTIRNEMRPYLYSAIKVASGTLQEMLAQAKDFKQHLQHLDVTALPSEPFGMDIASQSPALRNLHIQLPSVNTGRENRTDAELGFARRGLMVQVRAIMQDCALMTELRVTLGSDQRIRVVYTAEVPEDTDDTRKVWQYKITGRRGDCLPFALADI